MPRQSFLSTAFFVTASEHEAKKAVCSLPQHLPHIQLLKENTLAKSMRFLYEHTEKQIHTYIDVSILTVDPTFVCVSLHGSFTNGQSFYTDPDISHALQSFQQSLNAFLKNDFSAFQANATKKATKKRHGYFSRLFISIFPSRYSA